VDSGGRPGTRFAVIRRREVSAAQSPPSSLAHRLTDCSDLPLIGLRAERTRIATARRTNDSLLVLGARGSGKTRLLRECWRSVPGTAFVEYSTNFHELLQRLALELMEAGHERLSRCVPGGAAPERWLAKQTSVHLRGILWKALEESPAGMILDGIEAASFPVFRFFQRIYFVRGMSIIASARDAVALGALGRLFWDPKKIVHVSALSDAASAKLFESAARRYRIDAVNMREFRNRALEAADGNGGQIVEMCRLASRPEYLTASRRIKFELVRIDCLVRTMG